MKTILQLKDIWLSFTNVHNETFDLLRGINLDVEEGKITALVGGNGAGKTTIFNIISGFQKDYSGSVYFEGSNISNLAAHQISRRGIGRLFQNGQLLSGLTLIENMKVASNNRVGETPYSLFTRPLANLAIESEREQHAKEILSSFFGVDNKYQKMLNTEGSFFSYGEQRMLSMIRLLMSENRLILLDEPTSGVNPVFIDTIERIIHHIVKEEHVTVLLIEHNMHFVRKIADTCAYLDEGVIAMSGPTADILDDKNVRNSYLGL
ncbi:MAG: ABC transporter ATP-binding protein [Bacteroidaceae bacterium]|nr:ABC transporter ATP-binding protein [Bacteroidaceae bacterium]